MDEVRICSLHFGPFGLVVCGYRITDTVLCQILLLALYPTLKGFYLGKNEGKRDAVKKITWQLWRFCSFFITLQAK